MLPASEEVGTAQEPELGGVIGRKQVSEAELKGMMGARVAQEADLRR